MLHVAVCAVNMHGAGVGDPDSVGCFVDAIPTREKHPDFLQMNVFSVHSSGEPRATGCEEMCVHTCAGGAWLWNVQRDQRKPQ